MSMIMYVNLEIRCDGCNKKKTFMNVPIPLDKYYCIEPKEILSLLQSDDDSELWSWYVDDDRVLYCNQYCERGLS